MKITKFEQSCLLVEMPAPVNRTALFDPGIMSKDSLKVDDLKFLDDIIVTHGHGDHFSLDIIKQLVTKFPLVRITATPEAVIELEKIGISAGSDPSNGISFFDSPHESVQPLFGSPQQFGVHYLDLLSHPGDSHSFAETKQILALPVTAPWGSTIKAINLALELKPKYILPIHDWHWREEARTQMYGAMEQVFDKNGIKFIKLQTGEPVVLMV